MDIDNIEISEAMSNRIVRWVYEYLSSVNATVQLVDNNNNQEITNHTIHYQTVNVINSNGSQNCSIPLIQNGVLIIYSPSEIEKSIYTGDELQNVNMVPYFISNGMRILRSHDEIYLDCIPHNLNIDISEIRITNYYGEWS